LTFEGSRLPSDKQEHLHLGSAPQDKRTTDMDTHFSQPLIPGGWLLEVHPLWALLSESFLPLPASSWRRCCLFLCGGVSVPLAFVCHNAKQPCLIHPSTAASQAQHQTPARLPPLKPPSSQVMVSFSWRCLLPQSATTPTHLTRSSHAVSYVAATDTLYLYGGENQPRIPVDNVLYSFSLSDPAAGWAPVAASSSVSPPERIAPGMVAVEETLYVLGGRQGITVCVRGGVGWGEGVCLTVRLASILPHLVNPPFAFIPPLMQRALLTIYRPLIEPESKPQLV